MKALVIGGTGPSGPHLVNGLLERRYQVAVLHGGQHEAKFDADVEHIHADPHFKETLEAGLANRTFDLAVATYGRIRIVADVLKGKTQRLITVGGGGVYARSNDDRWAPLGAPPMVPEDSPLSQDPNGPRLSYMMWVTEQTVMQAHQDGFYSAAIFRYPQVYGPNAPANPEWSIVRRLLDGRKHLVVPNTAAPRRRAFGKNAAHALLLGVDKPEESSGQIYNVREDAQYSQRQIVEFIIKLMGADCEIVEMPPALASRVYRGSGAPAVEGAVNYDITKIKSQLGYSDVVPVSSALARSVEWLLENRPEPGGEIEMQLGDPFAYEAEDALVAAYREGSVQLETIRFPEVQSGHMYRHPRQPGEAWAPPSRS